MTYRDLPVLAAFFVTEEREELVDMIKPYYYSAGEHFMGCLAPRLPLMKQELKRLPSH